MYQLKILAEAAQELRKEIQYSKRTCGTVHARKYHNELKEQINLLRSNPLLYPTRDDILPGIRIKTYKGNQIVYLAKQPEELVVILAVLSSHQTANQDKLKKRV